MALIKWNDGLSVGVAQFDAHHRRLVDIMNELHDQMMNGRGQESLGSTLGELLRYAAYHFGEEERAMLANGFQGYAEHKSRHDAFIDKVRQFERDSVKAPLPLTIDLMDFLREWLTDHIMGTDKKYSGRL